MATYTDSISAEANAMLYLDLLKQHLTRTSAAEKLRPAEEDPYVRGSLVYRAFCALIKPALSVLDLKLARPFSDERRTKGMDWPSEAETMVGRERLDNLQYCVTEVIRKRVPGDLIETGVWRGGASIFMRAVLKAYGDTDRIVWVADSFEGLPKPDGRYEQDRGDRFWTLSDVLAVPLEQVQSNFRKFGLLDDQVRFLKGWFKDTLPTAPIERLAVMRLDGDMYSSTMDGLENLYPKLSPGGFAIIDDYHAVAVCRKAVDDYRRAHNIRESVRDIDGIAVYWEKK